MSATQLASIKAGSVARRQKSKQQEIDELLSKDRLTLREQDRLNFLRGIEVETEGTAEDQEARLVAEIKRLNEASDTPIEGEIKPFDVTKTTTVGKGPARRTEEQQKIADLVNTAIQNIGGPRALQKAVEAGTPFAKSFAPDFRTFGKGGGFGDLVTDIPGRVGELITRAPEAGAGAVEALTEVPEKIATTSIDLATPAIKGQIEAAKAAVRAPIDLAQQAEQAATGQISLIERAPGAAESLVAGVKELPESFGAIGDLSTQILETGEGLAEGIADVPGQVGTQLATQAEQLVEQTTRPIGDLLGLTGDEGGAVAPAAEESLIDPSSITDLSKVIRERQKVQRRLGEPVTATTDDPEIRQAKLKKSLVGLTERRRVLTQQVLRRRSGRALRAIRG
jgi:hypothetical protein